MLAVFFSPASEPGFAVCFSFAMCFRSGGAGVECSDSGVRMMCDETEAETKTDMWFGRRMHVAFLAQLGRVVSHSPTEFG